MVLPDFVLEAVDALPDEESWDLIRAYLDTGGDVDDVDAESDGLTMLSQFLICHDMRDEASLRFVRFLVEERGADVNKVDDDGRNALYFACNSGGQFGLDVVRLIIDAGANIDAKTTRARAGEFLVGETPLSTAIDWLRHWDTNGRSLAYASLLISRGASIDDCWGGRSAEDCMRHVEDPSLFFSQDPYDARNPETVRHESFIALNAVIADARRRKLRAPARAILTLRTLALRGRAAPADSILKFIVDLPDGVAWNVLSYWPPRRYPYYLPASTYRGERPGYAFATRRWCPDLGLTVVTKTGYFLDDPMEHFRLECKYDACDRFVHELLPRMELGQLKKMLATLKPFARDAYKAAMATREGKDAAAARKVVRSLFEHITSGDILSAYAKATKPG